MKKKKTKNTYFDVPFENWDSEISPEALSEVEI